MLRTSIIPAFSIASSLCYAPTLRALTSIPSSRINPTRTAASSPHRLASRNIHTNRLHPLEPFNHTPICTSKRLIANWDVPVSLDKKRIQNIWVRTKAGLWLRIQVRIDYEERNPNMVDFCIESCTNELFTYFSEKDASDIALTFTLEQSYEDYRLTHDLDPALIATLKRYVFSTNPLLKLSIMIPYAVRTLNVGSSTSNNGSASATIDMVYQPPANTNDAVLMRTKVDRLLRDRAHRWRAQTADNTTSLLEVTDSNLPFKYIEQPELPESLVFQRVIVNSVTKSIHERFIEGFTKKYPLILPIEACIALAGGLPLMLARLGLRYVTIKVLAKKQQTDYRLQIDDDTDYRRIMRWGTVFAGFVLGTLALTIAKALEDCIWDMDNRGINPNVRAQAALLFGVPYTSLINMIINNQVKHRNHKCRTRIFE